MITCRCRHVHGNGALMALCVALALITGGGGAQAYSDDFDEKPWEEQQTQLPVFPRSENLLPVRLETMQAFQPFVDGKSLDLGRDGVIRYVLVAVSPSGSRNVTFEGIRCETRERKIYAVGRGDATWAEARGAKWTAYGGNPRLYQNELARKYFCPRLSRVSSVEHAVENIRRGGYEQ